MPVLKSPPAPVSVPQMLTITANGVLQMKAAWIGPVVDLAPVVQRLRESANLPFDPYVSPVPSRAILQPAPVTYPHHTAKGEVPATPFLVDGCLNPAYVHDAISDNCQCSDLVVQSHSAIVGSSSRLKSDEANKNFGDVGQSPLGGTIENVLHVDLTGEYNAAKTALGRVNK